MAIGAKRSQTDVLMSFKIALADYLSGDSTKAWEIHPYRDTEEFWLGK